MTPKVKSLVVVMALAAVAGCGNGKSGNAPGAGGGQPAPAGGAGGDKAPAPAGATQYDAAKSTASVSGTIKWTGAKPQPQEIAVAGDQFCMEHAKSEKMWQEKLSVADDGGLPHTFVWALKGPHKQMTGFPAGPKVVLDQKGCTYVPHVFGLRAGESFTVKNSDNTNHNVHARPKTNTNEINKPQSKDQADDFTFTQKEVAVPFNCDIHTWMSAYGFVLDHPFFTTTDANGKYSIKGLPAGTYTFRAWHESFSADKTEMTQDFEVTVKDGEAATKDVEFK